MARTAIHPPPSPRSRDSDARARILAAAEQDFAREGLAGARTDAIAAAAGVNKALLYYYFKSKQALYQAVIEERFSEFNRLALETLNAPGSARAVLLKYVNLHLDFISASHQTAPMFHHMLMTGGKFLQYIVQKYFVGRGKALGALIARGVREGEFRRVDAYQTSVSIVSLIVFYFSAARVMALMGHEDAYSAANLRKRKKHVLEFVRHALFVDPS